MLLADLAEGIVSSLLPCSFLLFLPAAAVMLAGRGGWLDVASALVAGVFGIWWRATGHGAASGWGSVVVGLVLAVGVLAIGLPAIQGATTARRLSSGLIAGMLAALAGALWWQPCVGRELGDLLTRGPEEPLAIVPGIAAYGVGVLLPIPLVSLAKRAFPESGSRLIRLLGVGIGVGLGLAAAVGIIDSVASTLARWSIEISDQVTF